VTFAKYTHTTLKIFFFMALKNIQILLETMTRCGGNCSGCALSSIERMTKSDLDFNQFEKQQKCTYSFLSQHQAEDIESISLFLGQGDHFLMQDYEIEPFVKMCSALIPENMKHKTVVFITASAIGKYETIKYKMDLFYEYSIKYQIPFFIQVVFDPKKMLLHSNFSDTYLKNILYFKEKCGMTELTINLGQDLYEYITPQEFHEWVITHNFKHVEMNWVLNKETHHMWKNSAKPMFEWLQKWLLIHKNDPLYEINFVSFLSRSFLDKDMSFYDIKEKVNTGLQENIYIDILGNVHLCQMGLISNITPLNERLIKNHSIDDLNNLSLLSQQKTNQVVKNLIKNMSQLRI
jgi:hypothetical protein